ncbi:MAG TPA: hypothetical protein VHE99_02660 [Gammaproteobacteria bacterium]|nr:hypothetical protein [Gammaproteobacteria bacterium]
MLKPTRRITSDVDKKPSKSVCRLVIDAEIQLTVRPKFPFLQFGSPLPAETT